MGRESSAWHRLRDVAKSIPEAPDMERVEVTGKRGRPDVDWIAPDGLAGRIELKAIYACRSPGLGFTGRNLGVRAEQAVHLRRIAERGGLAGVVAYAEMLDEWLYWRALPTVQWAEAIREMPGLLPLSRFPNTRDGIAAMMHAWRDGRRVVIDSRP
jgi:hypothetical protein